jgi:ankyrin
MPGWDDRLFTASSKKELEDALRDDENHIDDQNGLGTSLMNNASKGHIDLVKVLLDMGADINALSVYTGNNAVIEAVKNGHTRVLEYLLANGAKNLGHRNRLGDSALLTAIKSDHPTCVRVLLDNGASPHDIDRDLLSAISCSARFGFTSIAKILLKYGADPNGYPKGYEPRPYGYYDRTTPLTHACQQGHKDIVELLLEHGASPEAGNPVYYAVLHGYNNIMELLIEHGAKIDPEELSHYKTVYGYGGRKTKTAIHRKKRHRQTTRTNMVD